MKLVLSHSTALDLVRAWRCGAPFQLTRTRATSLDNVAHTRSAIEQFEVPVFPRSDARTHVLVADAAQLGRSDAHVCHLETQDLPVGALMRVGEDVLAASSALLFVQHAARLPWLQAAMLGAELCGTYSLLPGGERGMRQSVPATSVSALRAFAAKMPRARGAHAAAEALRWVPDAAASPMEAAIYLLLSLPIRRGGYGLPAPLLNPPTALDVRRNRHLPVDELHCDLHWRDAHVALEYNSKDAHVGHLTRDARRANVLTSEGERVFTMTPAILADACECDALVRQVARALGYRLQGNALAMTPKRAQLREELFPWVSETGRFAGRGVY